MNHAPDSPGPATPPATAARHQAGRGDEGPVLRLVGIERSYDEARGKLTVLNGAELSLYPGELVALVASSGAGKSTLLHIAGLLERPTAGEVRLGGVDTNKLTDMERTRLRRTEIGFIYQFHHLLPEFTARENVMMPQLIRGLDRKEAVKRADALLNYLKLGERLDHRPSELSGGEQQRVAIARAVANAPRVLLADEPTGNLDPTTSDYVFETLIGLARSSRLGALIVTHNHELAKRLDRRITLEDGKVVPL